MGSCKYNYEIISSGNEKSFYSNVIAYITGLSDDITCSGSIDQFDSSDLTIKPTFVFSINEKEFLTIQRIAALNSNTNGMNVTFKVGSALTATYNIITGSDAAASTSQMRHIFVSHIISGSFLLMYIDQGNVQYGAWNSVYFVYIGSLDNSYGYCSTPERRQAKNSIFNISALNFYNFNGGTGGAFVSRFNYTSKPGTIDYIKSSIYCSSSERSFETTSIYDCTTVNIGDTVSLNDGAYLAVGTNQLVKVS